MTSQAQIPTPWYVPFATGDASRVEIPVTSSDPTRASQTLGFPPLTMQPPESGGVPPQGEDFNGAMNQIARVAWWMLNGGLFPYNSTFATNANINGYPNGAVLLRSDLSGLWLNLADNNQVAPDAATGLVATNNWAPLTSYGRSNITGLTGGTTTLSYAQAGFERILLSGALTSNQTVVLPNWTKRWLIVNNTTGNFTLTVQPPTGAGVIVPQNAAETPVVCDGTNMALPLFNVVAATTGTQPAQMAQVQSDASNLATDTGAANALVASLTPAPASLAAMDGAPFAVKIAHNNTGATTLNLNGLGVQNVYGLYGTALQGGELIAGGRAFIFWSQNVGAFVLLYCQDGALQVAPPTASNHAAQFANIGSFQGIVSVSSNVTLTTASFGLLYEAATGDPGGRTITFPSATGNGGKVIALINSSTGNWTLSAGNINCAYGSGSTIIMPPNSTGVFVSDSTSFNAVAGSAGFGGGVRPQAGGGVGQWTTPSLTGSGSSTFWTLPAGGTWAYFVSNSGTSAAGIAAGGANVLGPFTAANAIAFCWRIA